MTKQNYYHSNRERMKRRVQEGAAALSLGVLSYLHNDRRWPCGVAERAFRLESAVNAKTSTRIWRRIKVL
jgi:hypothetical protein